MKNKVRLWAICAGPIVTLAVSLGWTANTDSFKLLALGTVSGFPLAEIISVAYKYFGFWKSSEFKTIIIFLLGLFLPVLFSNSPISQQIYGVSGRNLGLLHYLFLIFVFLGFSTLDFKNTWPLILKSLVVVGLFEACYGGLQFIGFDPAPWKNPDKWMLGTFGNPNYLSSFLGFSALASMFFCVCEKKVAFKSFYLITILFQVWIIILTDSIQGLILVSFGVCSLSSILAFSRSRILGFTSALSTSAVGLLCLLGIFQIGPLTKYLYQESVSFRGDYWRAGLKMFQNNWLHGVGLDSYGDYYRIYRDAIAANRRGADVFSNSAHNLLIDLAATGGIILLCGYLLIVGLVALSIINTYRFSNNVPLDFKILVILWAAFHLQTLISINVPSLAIWGSIFSGLILAYNNTNKSNYLHSIRGMQRSKHNQALTKSLCVSLCIILVAPLINHDVKLANALAGNQISEITNAVLAFPRDSEQIAGISQAYAKIGRGEESLKLAKKAITENENSFRAWNVIYLSSYSSPNEKKLAEKKLRLLNRSQYSTSK